MTASHFALMTQYAFASLHVGCKLTMTSLPGASSTTSFVSSSRFDDALSRRLQRNVARRFDLERTSEHETQRRRRGIAFGERQFLLRKRTVPIEHLVSQPTVHAVLTRASREFEADRFHLKVSHVLSPAVFAALGETVPVKLAQSLAIQSAAHVETVHVTRHHSSHVSLAREPTSAMCESVGVASAIVVSHAGAGKPDARRVHTPFGPRKSGIPASREIPAPVCATHRPLAFDNRFAKTVALTSTTRSSSSTSGSPSVPPTSASWFNREAYPTLLMRRWYSH